MNQDLDILQNFELQNQQNQVLSSTKLLADQLEDVWNQSQNINTPQECYITQHVVVCGMGGSALPARTIQSAFKTSLRGPLIVNTDFSLPHFVGPQSLVIISSYSGNTAEALNCLYRAQSANAKVFVLTSGGKLAEEINAGVTGLIFKTDKNPSNQPRLGLGYGIGALLAILARCQYISLTELEIQQALKQMRRSLSDFAPDKLTAQNLAKSLAIKFKTQSPIIVASSHLLGAAHAMKNQVNETAKTFSALFDLPELNHHLMEGLKHPALLKQNLKFLFLNSDLYSEEIKTRYKLTEEVVSKNEIKTETYMLEGGGRLDQVLQTIVLGTYFSYYLSFLRGEDPSQIPWVDYFKKRLQ